MDKRIALLQDARRVRDGEITPEDFLAIHTVAERRFRLEQLIDEDEWTRRWSAWDLNVKREVQVETLAPRLQADPESRARFVERAMSIARLRHPAIGLVLEIDPTDETDPWLVSEPSSGWRLQDACRVLHRPSNPTVPKSALDLPALLHVFLQVLEAVRVAHERGVAHGRLSSRAIELGAGGAAVLRGWAPLPTEPLDPTSDRNALRAILLEILTGERLDLSNVSEAKRHALLRTLRDSKTPRLSELAEAIFALKDVHKAETLDRLKELVRSVWVESPSVWNAPLPVPRFPKLSALGLVFAGVVVSGAIAFSASRLPDGDHASAGDEAFLSDATDSEGSENSVASPPVDSLETLPELVAALEAGEDPAIVVGPMSLDWYLESVDQARERRAARPPSSVEEAAVRALTDRDLARASAALGRLDLAERAYQRALRILDRLSESTPKRRDLADAHVTVRIELGELHAEYADIQEAKAHFDEAIAIAAERLGARRKASERPDPKLDGVHYGYDQAYADRLMARALLGSAQCAFEIGAASEALTLATEAGALGSDLLASRRSITHDAILASRVALLEGRARLVLDHPEAALEALNQAIRDAERLLNDERFGEKPRLQLARALVARARLGDTWPSLWSAGSEDLSRAVQLSGRTQEGRPLSPRARRIYAEALLLRGTRRDCPEHAPDDLRRALDQLAKRVDLGDRSTRTRGLQVQALVELGVRALDRDDRRQARTFIDQARSLLDAIDPERLERSCGAETLKQLARCEKTLTDNEQVL